MPRSSPLTRLPRREFFRRSAALGLGATALVRSLAGDTVTLPFLNGERPLVKYPQKRPLLRLTARPPQLETPFEVFNESLLTPNDAFFVRYHLTNSPPRAESLQPDKFRVAVKGKVATPLTFSVEELKTRFEQAEVVAVNQCSGNSRGFFQPRVQGGQLGHGAMGCARWRGVRLADVLKAAGVDAAAKQVVFNGLDTPLLPQTPDFLKAIAVDQALDPELLLAFEMNGEPLPWLNGFPLRLVVPGYYGTYWVKHLNEITVLDDEFKGFWMNPAYRIPDEPCGAIEPGTSPKRTVPITRFNVRSFITSVAEGATLKTGAITVLRGIAFDDGHGIREVLVSADGGRSWRAAELGRQVDKYAFREWTMPFTPERAGKLALMAKATNRLGQSQPLEPLWNPSGYMRNCVETVNALAA
ncbi:MAG TPA: molybdopterin-dependent oxidoreductase [Candidatus Limnocylindria bacterium]|nr:molybdopterin-dependent oxidoreductase [Candidatus Limnocylindria bacterium]